MSASDEKTMRALGRVLRTWSLIKFVPMRAILPHQAPLLRLLSARPDLSEDQLVALGLKQLYSIRNASEADKPNIAASDVAALLGAASKRVSGDDIVKGRSRRQSAYIVTAVRDRVRLSIRRKGIDEAIEAAEGYHGSGATTVSIRAPDGKTYSLDELNALRRNIQ